MSRLAGWCLLTSAAFAAAVPAADGEWVTLFNGKDLTGWKTTLGVPAGGKAHASVTPIGRGRDPKGVFRVVSEDGGPAIRISGENYGGLATLREYGDYHLELEFKWGRQRFAPRAELPRDSGLLYHGTDSRNPSSGWLESLEFGILEGGETGDFWSVPGAHGIRVQVDVEAEDIPAPQRRYPNEPIKYRRGGKQYAGVTSGILNGDDNEKPRGQWNKMDLYCLGQTSIHVVNGTANLVLTNARRKVGLRDEPLARGRLQLQSEGAEVYFRRLRLRPIRELPPEVRRALAEPPPNTLTDEERAAGWRLLFDGRTTRGWRGYRKKAHASVTAPTGWQARDGTLARVDKAGDLVTTETFGDFDLLIDWKISHGGNSGIFYRATEETKVIFHTSPEYEIRDNAFWLDDPFTTAACYALYPPAKDATRPVGFWNRAKIVARGDRVEHWLNGERVVAYERGSPDWQERVAASKYHRKFPDYGKAARGHVGLQDHGDPVWLRNIKIKP